MSDFLYRTGQRVKVLRAPGLEGEHVGIIRDVLEGGYGVEVSGPYYCGTNAKREVRTEVNFIEGHDLQPIETTHHETKIA